MKTKNTCSTDSAWELLVNKLKRKGIHTYADGIGNFGFSYHGYSLGGYTDGDKSVEIYTAWKKNRGVVSYCGSDHIIGVESASIKRDEFGSMTIDDVVDMLVSAKEALLAKYPAAAYLEQYPCGGPVRQNRFIVFEGIDNSGKTTVSKKLSNKLSWYKWSKEPVFTTEQADRLNSDEYKGKDAKREVLFLEGRLKQQELYNTRPVMLDRYIWSGLAYAKAFSPKIYNFCEALYTDFNIFKKPDLIFFMDTPVETCYDREPALKKEPGRLEKILRAYKSTRKLLSGEIPIITVDGTMSVKDCVKFCYDEIVKLYPDQTIV